MINLFSPFISVAHAVTISMNIPGGSKAYPTSTGPGGFIANFYQFALMIGGVLAFGIIVYGGVRYMTSAGNPSGQSDAKEWIESALLGLLLLVGAYFILSVINPQLLNLQLPTLQAVNITSQTSAPGASSAICGSLDANGRSQVGQCVNSPNGNINNCCFNSGTYSCQASACGTTACGSIDAQGNSQSGVCPASGNCCSSKDNNTGFITYSCKATAC